MPASLSGPSTLDPLALAIAALAAAIIAVTAYRARAELALALETIGRLFVTAWVFAGCGLAWVVARLRGHRRAGPELVRLAFEELGPTYLKLAQLVASSEGLFPESYCQEFRKTLDAVRPFGFADVERILTAELGGPPSAHFARIDPAPLASASVAQVHAATLVDGRQVVLKIQRPGIERRVRADVRILGFSARLLSLAETVELANPVGIVEDFGRTIDEELDFRLEAANMDEFNRIMGELGHADVRAPRVEHALTTRRLITMERFVGVRVDDIAAIRARQVDSEERLIHGLRAWFQCMLLYGFFHGDVHAGNLMLLDDGALGFLDFGIIGRFNVRTRQLITQYLAAFSAGDYRRLGRVLLDMNAVASGVDLDAMALDLAAAYAPMLTRSFADLSYGEVLPAILRASVKHGMRMPREFVLVTKQMLYFDRYAKLLAPEINVFSDPRLVTAVSEAMLRVHFADSAPA